MAVVECARYPLYVAHSKGRPDISLCRITLIWYIDQESHSEIIFSIHRQWASGPLSSGLYISV